MLRLILVSFSFFIVPQFSSRFSIPHNPCCYFTGIPINALDQEIRRHVLALIQPTMFEDGVVLAGTIVEGGPVTGRPRLILGGKHAHPGLLQLPGGGLIQDCQEFTLDYKCETSVPKECLVVRHLLTKRQLCKCKVNVC